MIKIKDIATANIHIFFIKSTPSTHDKFHCFLKEGYYFFINSLSRPGDETLLLKCSPDYSHFLVYDSHLQYSHLRKYHPETEIKKDTHRGSLISADIRRLMNAVKESVVLKPKDIKRIVEYLDPYAESFNPLMK